MNEKELKVIEPGGQVAAVTPMHLLQIATEKGADVDKLEQLMQLQFTWEANEARKAFVSAMAKFRGECPTIVKNSTVDFTSQKGRTHYKHANLAGTLDQIKQLLGDCGLSHRWETKQDKDVVNVTCIVTHILGHSESTTLMGTADSSGGKNPIQAIGSTVQYLQRYTLSAILGLASDERDDDGQGSSLGFINEEQVETLRDLIVQSKADIPKFLKFLNADSIPEILMSSYGKAESSLKAKLNK